VTSSQETRCAARSASGARCTEPAGHSGNHAHLTGSGGFTWPASVELRKPKSTPVRLEGRVVGHIVHRSDGRFQYFPKGKTKGGEVFGSFSSCARSLGPGVSYAF
jgi:hypothetical protein